MVHDRTILVTGGAGFIGSNYVLQRVKKADVCVINLDALTYAGNLETLSSIEHNPEHHFVLGSIGDRSLIDYLMSRYRPCAIVNFAAETHVDRSIDAPNDFIQTNVNGTFELLDAATQYWKSLRGAEKTQFRFLHISTDEVYGSLGTEGTFTESSPYRPNSPYSASKAASDHMARAFHKTYGLPVLTTNCSNNYGPYQFPEKLIPLVIMNALRGEKLPVYGQGTNIRDWLYVADHCAAIDIVLESGIPGEVYNIGGNNERTNLDVVNTLCSILDRLRPESPYSPHTDLIEFVSDRPGHDFRYAIDTSKIEQELGWSPSETFETGLSKTVAWYLDNVTWCQRVQDGSYRGERLGLKSVRI